MAEIEIQRKKRPVWPWILAAIAALLVIWLIVESLDKDENKNIEGEAAMVDEKAEMEKRKLEHREYEGLPGQVVPFLLFANNEMNTDPNQHHGVTHHGLLQLTESLRFINEHNKGGEANMKKLDMVRAEGEKLMNDPTSNLHSAMMRNAFIMATDVMANLEERFYPDTKPKVEVARQAAEEMDANKPALEQQSRIKSFFSKSADVVEAMAKNIKQ